MLVRYPLDRSDATQVPSRDGYVAFRLVCTPRLGGYRPDIRLNREGGRQKQE